MSKEKRERKPEPPSKPFATLYEVWASKVVIERNPEIKRTVWVSNESRRTDSILHKIAEKV